MKKTSLMIFSFIAVVAIAAGIAYAYFTKIDTVADNTIQAGTLEISIVKDLSWQDIPIAITGMMPGDTKEVVFDVKNDSTVPVNLAGKVSGQWDFNSLDEYITVTGASYWDEGSVSWKPMEPSSTGPGVYYQDYGALDLLALAPGGTEQFKLAILFETGAGDIYQSEIYRASLDVAATQVGGVFPAGF